LRLAASPAYSTGLVHHLVFRRPSLNRVMAIVANFAMVFPATIMFCIYHLKHHSYLGNPRHDADIAPRWEARLLHGGFLGRLLWMCLYPFTQGLRSIGQDKRARPASWVRWIGPNVLAVVVFDLVFFWICGPGCFRYLLLSVFFSIGPHPLGARWIQEHYVFRLGQETYSYYGPLNVVSLNIGYHNEHHDLPQIAWHRLPTLKRLAPEMYQSLHAHRSLVRLWLRFLFDRNLQVYRIGRE
jgi:sphingolipid 4-desaturase/C4-monooxygenase